MPSTNTLSAGRSQSDHLFRLLIERVCEYAIFMIDKDGRVITWNRGAESLKGYAAHEILGQSWRIFYPDDARRDGKPERLLQAALRDGQVEDEGWRIRRDGTRFWAHVSITAIYDEEDVLVGFAKITRDSTERRLAELALREAREHLEERMKQLERTNEELRRSKQVLLEKISELEDFHDLVVDRELRMMELEKELAALRKPA